jgi:hypothetical protein
LAPIPLPTSWSLPSLTDLVGSLPKEVQEIGSSLRSLPDQLPWREIVKQLVKSASADSTNSGAETTSIGADSTSSGTDKKISKSSRLLNKPLEDIEDLVDTR